MSDLPAPPEMAECDICHAAAVWIAPHADWHTRMITCPICGCVMADPTAHVLWHASHNEPLPA